MDKENQRNKKHHMIQDARAYYNNELKRKKEREEQYLNERNSQINTSLAINELKKNEEYKRNFNRREDNIDRNIGSYIDYNQQKEVYKNKYGNRELFDQMRNSPTLSI